MNRYGRAMIGCLMLGLVAVWASHGLLVTPRICVEQQMADQALERTRQTLDRLDMAIASKIEALQIYARSLASHAEILASNAEFAKLPDMEAHIQAVEAEWGYSQPDSQAPLLKALEEGSLSRQLQVHLMPGGPASSMPKEMMFGEAFVTNRYGANVAQTQRTTDYYQADEPWWQAVQTEGVYVGEVGYDQSSGVHGLVLATAIVDTQGIFQGVLKVWLNLNGLVTLLDQATQSISGNGTWVLLADEHDRVIHDQSGLYALGENLTEVPLFALMQGDAGTFFRQEGMSSDPWLFSYARSQGHHNHPQRTWLLLVAYNAQVVLSATEDMVAESRVALGALLLTAVGAILWMIRSTPRSLGILHKVVAEIEVGRRPRTIPVVKEPAI